MRYLCVLVVMVMGVTSVALAQESDQTFQGFNLQGYDESGNKTWDVTGDTADIEGGEVKISNVDANTFGEQKVNVTAKTGIVHQESGDMHLEKDVVITSERGTQLLTDSLDWNRNDDLVTTDDDVVITDNEFTASGKGMQAEPGLKTAQIQEDVTVTVQSEPEEQPENVVTITCDGPLIIDQAQSMATFEENVVAIQGARRLKADRMEVFFDQEAQHIKKLVCIGNVEITQGENKSFADEATYMADEQIVILSGRPKLIMITEGENAITSTGD